jgi:hypothetical protein
VYTLIDRIEDKIHPNRSIDPIALEEWGETVADLRKRLWSGKDHVHWYCPELFTFTENPLAKQAIASLLHSWGIHHSEVDCVPTFALCTLDLKEMYETEGYKVAAEVQCGPSQCLAMKFQG